MVCLASITVMRKHSERGACFDLGPFLQNIHMERLNPLSLWFSMTCIER